VQVAQCLLGWEWDDPLGFWEDLETISAGDSVIEDPTPAGRLLLKRNSNCKRC
jgi:hypothetical protein